MMLYPKILNIKKSNLAIKIVIIISIAVALISLIVDFAVGLKFHWSFLVLLGIIYTWITTMYSIRKNVNIASHVMIQMICLSILLVLIDYVVGYKGWSINWAIPIGFSVANITMLVLTIVNHKRYFKYAIYQIIIFLLSFIPLILYILKISTRILPVIILSSITIVTSIVVISLCGKDIKEEIQRIFHI